MPAKCPTTPKVSSTRTRTSLFPSKCPWCKTAPINSSRKCSRHLQAPVVCWSPSQILWLVTRAVPPLNYSPWPLSLKSLLASLCRPFQLLTRTTYDVSSRTRWNNQCALKEWWFCINSVAVVCLRPFEFVEPDSLHAVNTVHSLIATSCSCYQHHSPTPQLT